MLWKPDYAAYYAAADKDEPNESVLRIIRLILKTPIKFNIWCDLPNTMDITDELFSWFNEHISCDGDYDYILDDQIKLRPDGDTTPWHELKEKWFYEITGYLRQRDPKMAFEPSGSPMIETWKKYGVPCLEVHDGQRK